ncbi:hypothetical protein EUX98_g2998 [Antrodiella citrinella]|uniref:Uncharacterized protein n=1 Tax=Antrodiella citrinella TaxID=2447956 RepID=A0A4V3XJ04_9APHY|nr:hypothetical protein EUX98_g2998 [Antrodiella citrinella]
MFNAGGNKVNDTSDDSADDEQLQAANDIRQEIEVIEAEARRLLDAFNGLELSALVRHQQHTGGYGARTPAQSSSFTDLDGRFRAAGGSMSSPKPGSVRLARDHDAMSVRSSQSVQTMFSTNRAHSVHSKTHRSQAGVLPTLGSGTIPRKNSVSSISVHSRKSGYAVPMSPSASRTPTKSRLGSTLGSTSSVNLSRSANHLPLETVSEADRSDSPAWSGNDSASAMRVDGDGSQVAADEELSDIRRRRGEVTARYDARLEYLRARLRGAELREKLMRS